MNKVAREAFLEAAEILMDLAEHPCASKCERKALFSGALALKDRAESGAALKRSHGHWAEERWRELEDTRA